MILLDIIITLHVHVLNFAWNLRTSVGLFTLKSHSTWYYVNNWIWQVGRIYRQKPGLIIYLLIGTHTGIFSLKLLAHMQLHIQLLSSRSEFLNAVSSRKVSRSSPNQVPFKMFMQSLKTLMCKAINTADNTIIFASIMILDLLSQRKQVDTLISKNQVLQILYLKHHA